MKTSLIFSCEHGGNIIPARYQALFRGAQRVLQSHRGWDIGALGVTKDISQVLDAPLEYSTTSRLLVDLNRSLNSATLFSPFTEVLSQEEKEKILLKNYFPYRDRVSKLIASHIKKNRRVVHISVHSFTGIFNGVHRKADIGLLYDPRQTLEKTFSDIWMENLKVCFPELQLRRNNPYKGNSDSLTRTLRFSQPSEQYIGFELELKQEMLIGFSSPKIRKQFSHALARSISLAMEKFSKL